VRPLELQGLVVQKNVSARGRAVAMRDHRTRESGQ
jgi:hypothetical protein